MTESDVAKACDAFAEAGGWAVEDYSDTRKVRTCPGLPDRRYVHRPRRLRLWVELKAPGGKLTEAQHEFLVSELEAGGLAIVIDDVAQLAKVFTLLAGGRTGRVLDVAVYCAELMHLAALRGYRPT